MLKLELTQEEIEYFAGKIFKLNFPYKEDGALKEQPFYVQADWLKVAYDAVDGYNCVVTNIDFPDISVVKNCCRICKHVDLYRPACKLRGDDIALECVCSHFELFEFEDDE